mmetsp:Transcript_18711/g.28462  ORF Transcript_18711/g.28462 Transcript_18711/m.28462 type:complete len:685 (-) Transcript_18711:155-2209(-)
MTRFLSFVATVLMVVAVSANEERELFHKVHHVKPKKQLKRIVAKKVTKRVIKKNKPQIRAFSAGVVTGAAVGAVKSTKINNRPGPEPAPKPVPEPAPEPVPEARPAPRSHPRPYPKPYPQPTPRPTPYPKPYPKPHSSKPYPKPYSPPKKTPVNRTPYHPPKKTSTKCQGEKRVLDFDTKDIPAGDIVSDQYYGVTIKGKSNNLNPVKNTAMIFDSDYPTGDDWDLSYYHKGGILILSEDLNKHDPNDSDFGGDFTFTFDEPVCLESLVLLDNEEGAKITMISNTGKILNKIFVNGLGPSGDNSEEVVDLQNTAGVKEITIELLGSGAIDDFTYFVVQTPAPTPQPTPSPTKKPTKKPIKKSTGKPTPYPTEKPTSYSSASPTKKPTPVKTSSPTEAPTFGPLTSSALVVGATVVEDFRFGTPPQDTLQALPSFSIDPLDAESEFVYSLEGESGQSIDFEAVCGEHTYGLAGAIGIYSRPKADQYMDSFQLEADAKVECPYEFHPLSVPTSPEKDYLIVVYGFGEDAQFTLTIAFETPEVIGTDENVFANTADLGMIPTFYDDLAACGEFGIDFDGVDSSAVYSVIGETDQMLDFSATCKTYKGNEIMIFAFARTISYDGDFGPTEGFYCGIVETLVCEKGDEDTDIQFYGEEGSEYLFIALARGTGDEIALEVAKAPEEGYHF